MPLIELPPFPKTDELVGSQLHRAHQHSLAVPNEPFVSPTLSVVQPFLRKEVECRVLDEIAPYFFIFAKQRANHIDTLHEYDSTKRSVTITENPGLHLVRNYHVIYCKPIPHCLLNYDFWAQYLVPPEYASKGHPDSHRSPGKYPSEHLSIECKSALGLLRTYTYLITHESDFNVAIRVGLLPSTITYTQFQYFIQPFKSIPDAAVSPRYYYGHIRLTRLNHAVRLLRPKASGKMFPWSYDKMHWHAGQFVGRLAPPLLFVFASLTLVLSSMQVGLAAQPVGGDWNDFKRVALWFAVAIIIGILFVAVFVCCGVGMYAVNRVFVGHSVHQRWAGKNTLSEEQVA